MNQLRQWLSGLSARERSLVFLAAGLLTVAALYFALVLPLTTAAAKRAARVEQKSQDLAWMRQVAPQAMAAAASGAGPATGESLVVLVDRTGREAGLGGAIRDQSPSGEHGLRLRLEAASFDVLVAWLSSLQHQHGVRVDTATIDAAGPPGLVNASLTLVHGTAPSP
jgi:type II secretory pathway component PulM